MPIAGGHAFAGVTLAVAHVRNIDRRHGVVGQHQQVRAGRQLAQRFFRQQRGQRAFEAAQVQWFAHRLILIRT